MSLQRFAAIFLLCAATTLAQTTPKAPDSEKQAVLNTLTAMWDALEHADIDRYGLGTISQFRQTISTLPGVGSKVSLAAQHRFGSIRKAVNAGAEEWARLATVDKQGRPHRVGAKDAERIVRSCMEEA